MQLTLEQLLALGDVPLLVLIAWFLWQQRMVTEKHLTKIDTLLELLLKKPRGEA